MEKCGTDNFPMTYFPLTPSLCCCHFNVLSLFLWFLWIQETIYLVEGTGKDEDDTSGVVSTLRVRCLTEALPETRFHRLLHKGKFSEAEQFANLFGLDLQVSRESDFRGGHTSHAYFFVSKVLSCREFSLKMSRTLSKIHDLVAWIPPCTVSCPAPSNLPSSPGPL